MGLSYSIRFSVSRRLDGCWSPLYFSTALKLTGVGGEEAGHDAEAEDGDGVGRKREPGEHREPREDRAGR